MKLDVPENRTSTPGSDSGVPTVSIPDHELIRQIGKGAYGEVWLAKNIMGVYRAIKIVRRDGFDSHAPFHREFTGIKRFEPISRTHEGFVDILQVGQNESEGLFYYIMEVADDLEGGQDFDPKSYIPKTLGKAFARTGRFTVEQCVQAGMALCQALEHLHSHGLVHRDVKPSNIVFINGSPKLADIGLVTDSDHAHTFVGTEGFIPPEGPGSPAADIYGLGKALYEIASGRDRLDFPALPPDLEQMPERVAFLELNEALIKACRQNSADRYSSARDMYEDLALLVSQKSLRKLRILERRWVVLKRNSAIAASILLLLALVGFPIVREWQHSEELRERNIGVHSANGINKLDQGDYLGALAEFADVFELQKNQPARFALDQSRIASILASVPMLSQMHFLNPRVSSVEFSPDARFLLTAEIGKDVRLFDVDSGAEIKTPISVPRLASATFSPDSQFIVTCSQAGYASIWNLQTGGQIRLDHPANVMCAVYSHDGKRIATGCRDGHVRVWDADTGALQLDLSGHTGTVRCLAFSHDDRLLASGSVDSTARVWNLSLSAPHSFVLRHPDWAMDVAFSPDGKRLLTACHDNWARQWDLLTGQEFPSLMRHDGQVSRVGYSPDGSLIFTASMDATLRFWEAETTRPLQHNHLIRHSSEIFSAAYSPDGRRIATGCSDGAVRVWELDSRGFKPISFSGVVNDNGTFAARINGETVQIRNLADDKEAFNPVRISGTIHNLALSLDASTLAAQGSSNNQPFNSITLWKTRSPEQSVATVPLALTNAISNLALSPNGAFLTFQEGDVFHVTDWNAGRDWLLPDPLRFKSTVAFDLKSSRIAIGSGTQLGIFDCRTSNLLVPIFTVEGEIRRLVFSPSGDSLMVSQGDDSVLPKPAVLINLTGKEPKLTRLWHKDGQFASAFHPHLGRIATAGEDRRALIWDIKSGQEIVPPLVHSHQVWSIAYSQDGVFLGAITANKSIQIWDAATGHPVTPPIFSARRPSRIVFTADRNRFVTVDDPLQFSLWQMPQTTVSPDEAVALSRLLNSDLPTSGNEGARRFAETWEQVRGKIPRPHKMLSAPN